MTEMIETDKAETDANVILTKYKHVPPRLSDDWYQVEIPEFIGNFKPNLEGYLLRLTFSTCQHSHFSGHI